MVYRYLSMSPDGLGSLGLSHGSAPLRSWVVVFWAVVVHQLGELGSQIPGLWTEAKAFFHKNVPALISFWERYGLSERIHSAWTSYGDLLVRGIQTISGKAVSYSAGIFGAITGLFSWFVMPVYVVFFLLSPAPSQERLAGFLPFLKPQTRDDILFLVREFISILVSFFRGQLLIALLQGLLFAAGFSLAGLQYGFTLGLLLGLLNIVPYLGSLIGLSITLPLAFFQPDGELSLVFMVLGVFFGVQMIEGYLLTPKIMGDRTGLHPLAIMVAIFFWGTALSGLAGMVLAIPLTAFVMVCGRLLKAKYIHAII